MGPVELEQVAVVVAAAADLVVDMVGRVFEYRRVVVLLLAEAMEPQCLNP